MVWLTAAGVTSLRLSMSQSEKARRAGIFRSYGRVTILLDLFASYLLTRLAGGTPDFAKATMGRPALPGGRRCEIQLAFLFKTVV